MRRHRSTRVDTVSRKTDLLSLEGNEFLSLLVSILEERQSVRFRALGFSMYPSIRSGDYVVVVPVNPSQLHVGAIALYKNAQQGAALHRIVERNGSDQSSRFVVRGDNVVGDGEWIGMDSIVGIVSRVERNGQRPWIKRLRDAGRRLWRHRRVKRPHSNSLQV